MSRREIKQLPIKNPVGAEIPVHARLDLSDYGHVYGQAAALRFFDHNSKEDYQVIRGIMKAHESRKWMDDVVKLTWSDYQEWAGRHKADSYLFAVHDARLASQPDELAKIRGFVNFYCERGEKFRLKKMLERGYIKTLDSRRQYLEVSFALKPLESGEQRGSGLMSSALRQSCLQIRAMQNYPKNSQIVIWGFIDPQNIASRRTLESAGFVNVGRMKYDSSSNDESDLYILNWNKLQKLIRGKMLALFNNTNEDDLKLIKKSFDQVAIPFKMQSQQTDCHCGPAVVQSLLNYQAVEVSQDQVAEAGGAKDSLMDQGMKPQQLAQAVETLTPDLGFYFKQFTTARDLDQLVNKYKIPVGIDWQGLFYKSVEEETLDNPNADHGHYCVVIDINVKNDEITLADPFSEFYKFPRTFSYKWFVKRWWDYEDAELDKDPVLTRRLAYIVLPLNHKVIERLKFLPAKKLAMTEVSRAMLHKWLRKKGLNPGSLRHIHFHKK